MEPVIRNARAAVGVIVILMTGCDNVGWGGIDVAVVPPPPKAEAPQAGSEEPGVQPLPEQPILYYVVRSGDGAFITPVAQIAGDSLQAVRAAGDAASYAGRFVAEFMRAGAEFTLFSGGRRAGTLILRDAEVPATPACPLLPIGTGSLELSATSEATEFIALARADAQTVQPRADRPVLPSRIRIVAPILAERLIRARSAPLPGNWQAAMEQLTALPVANQSNPAFTATFLVGDTLGPGMDDTGYSLFFIGVPTPSQTGYDTTFVSFRSYPETGKAAPRVVDFLDWDRDESAEILLQVYGINDMWFEAVGRDQNGDWHRIYRDRCDDGGRTLPMPASAAGSDSAGQ